MRSIRDFFTGSRSGYAAGRQHQEAVTGDVLRDCLRKADPVGSMRDCLREADTVIIGAGAGLSESAGLSYSGKRFEENFGDFIEKYHFPDMYTAGFYPYPALEEYWAFWSRYIMINRYANPPKPVYQDLKRLTADKNCFVLTTNVDHQFQRAGFDKQRLFYTQGDYGLWQCPIPCHENTYDNEKIVRKMYREQKNMRIPTELIPVCPVCGRPMTMNLRSDDTFVEDEGWHQAQARYYRFLTEAADKPVLYLELGVGGNTPGIIKYPFWQYTRHNPRAVFASINAAAMFVPEEIQDQSVCITGDIGTVLQQL